MSVPSKSPYTLRLRQLPKPEYTLMKSLVSRYNLTDTTELFAIALSLLNEVEQYNNGQGHQWIINVIDAYRSTKEVDRTYPI